MLHLAVHRPQAAAICETLVACGSDIDALNEYGNSPLMRAVREYRPDIIRLLLALNADTTKTSNHGWNVSQTTNADILQLLSEHSKKTVSLVVLLPADVNLFDPVSGFGT